MDSDRPADDSASWLAEYFEQCVAMNSLGVVVLRSPTGWGKTSAVEAMYQTLAAAQPLPRYWPDDFGVATRKLIYPAPFRPSPGAYLPFVWWGLQGDLGADGQPRFGGYEINGQLEAIMRPLAEAIGADERLWRDRALSVLRAATSLTAITFLPVGETVRTVKLFTDIAAEVLELIPQLLGEIRGVGARTERARQAQGGSTVRTDGAAEARVAAERAGSILAVVSHVVPTVVAVEDAQFLDDHSVSMLRSWVRSELPVGLLVLTVATDRPGPGEQWRYWMDELHRSERALVVDLEPLPDQEMEQITLERLAEDRPGYTVHLAAVGELVLQAAGNPLTLHNLLDQPFILDALSTGRVDDIRLAAARPPAPNSGLQVAFDTFDTFDRLTQQSLAILAMLGQVTLVSWFDAAVRAGLDSISDRARALEALLSCGWCGQTSDGQVSFLDVGCQRIAARAAPDLIGEQRRGAILDRLHALIEASRAGLSWDGIPSRIRQDAIQLLLARPGTSPDDLVALSLELHEILVATGQIERRRRLLDLMEQQLKLVTRDIADQLVVTVGSSLLELGQTESALRIFRVAHRQQARDWGEDDPETLVALHNLAVALRAAGQPDAAVATFTDLLRRRIAVLPAHHRHIRDTRRDLAVTFNQQGRHAETRDQLEALHEDNIATLGPDDPVTLADDIQLGQSTTLTGSPAAAITLLEPLHARAARILGQLHEITRNAASTLAIAYQETGRLADARRLNQSVLSAEIFLLGPDDPRTLTIRNNFAGLSAQLGDITGAILEFERLLEDRERVLGPDHHDTLKTAGNLAYWRGQSGDPGAAAEFERLLERQLRVLGPNHPETFATRGNLAGMRGQAGDIAAAIAEFDRLLADQLRVLGPDYPETFATRGNLAGLRGQAGDIAAAIAEFDRLLADQLRMLGPDHPDTLNTRSNLAGLRGQTGDVTAAKTEFEQLLADQRRVLGPDHPETFFSRNNFAGLRGHSGDIAGAIAELEHLLADALRVLGPDHPNVFTIRNYLAFWRGQAGEVGSLAESEGVLNDFSRMLGADHPYIFVARNNLATTRGQAGDTSGALAELERLLADQLRILGPDYPDVLTTRNNLAYWRGQAGDSAGAAVETERLLNDSLRILGPTHPRTFATRINLADWHGQAGDTRRAITQLEELLIDFQHVFGPDHPGMRNIRQNLAYWRSHPAQPE